MGNKSRFHPEGRKYWRGLKATHWKHGPRPARDLRGADMPSAANGNAWRGVRPPRPSGHHKFRRVPQ